MGNLAGLGPPPPPRDPVPPCLFPLPSSPPLRLLLQPIISIEPPLPLLYAVQILPPPQAKSKLFLKCKCRLIFTAGETKIKKLRMDSQTGALPQSISTPRRESRQPVRSEGHGGVGVIGSALKPLGPLPPRPPWVLLLFCPGRPHPGLSGRLHGGGWVTRFPTVRGSWDT